MGNQYVSTALGKKINMAALREKNKTATPVGSKTIRHMVQEITSTIAPIPAKLNATIPSNKPVTSHSEVSRSNSEVITEETSGHPKKGRR